MPENLPEFLWNVVDHVVISGVVKSEECVEM